MNGDAVTREDQGAAEPPFNRQRAYDRETLEVRGRAAEVLAAIGPGKLRTVALFRACRWAELSAADYEQDSHLADLAWVRASEWLRIRLSLSNGDA
jgi:hypothetical protein